MSKLASAAVKILPRSSPVVSRAAITITPAAVSRLRTLLKREPSACAIRIGVKTKGCNGLTYTMDYAQAKAKFDEEVVHDDVKVFIDSKAQLSLLGTEMDFVETPLAAEFVFMNPNIAGTCGCGESFNLKPPENAENRVNSTNS